LADRDSERLPRSAADTGMAKSPPTATRASTNTTTAITARPRQYRQDRIGWRTPQA
jgi:hypothetical protein